MRAASWRVRRNILVVDALTPTPDQDSGSIVTDEVMSAYRECGFGESFFPLHSPYWSKKYTGALQRRGVCCYYKPYANEMNALLDIDSQFDYALLYRYNVAHPVYAMLRRRRPARASCSPTSTCISCARRVPPRPRTRRRPCSPPSHEEAGARDVRAGGCLVRPHRDRARRDPAVVAAHRSATWSCCHGSPTCTATRPAFAGRADIMFLGNFPHAPNVDSVLYFVKSIWPALERELPPAPRLLVVGNKPPPEVLSLASDRIVVTGFVEELEPYFQTSRVFVAPLRYGAGIKGKLVTALAHGVPSVATAIAAEGIAHPGEAIWPSPTIPQQFAAEVLRLYRDEAAWNAHARGRSVLRRGKLLAQRDLENLPARDGRGRRNLAGPAGASVPAFARADHGAERRVRSGDAHLRATSPPPLPLPR
jgi:glycosyltransferase involved in cell wall biosynthesis